MEAGQALGPSGKQQKYIYVTLTNPSFSSISCVIVERLLNDLIIYSILQLKKLNAGVTPSGCKHNQDFYICVLLVGRRVRVYL